MCNFIKSNGEQKSPQVNTLVVAEVVDTPAPSVIEPVEASNVEVSKVPELDESIVAPAVTESAVYGEEYNLDLKKIYNSDDEYDTDDEDEFIPATTKLASPLCGSEPIRAVEIVNEIRDDSWMYESDDSCSDDDSIVWDEPHNESLDESSLEEFERVRQAEQYAEYEEASEKDATPSPIEIVNPTKPKAKTATDEFTKEITSEDEIKEIILKKIVNDMMLLDKDLIRKCNKVDLYDLSSLRNVTIDVFKLALLIRQTLVRTDNNGLPMWYGKNNTKLRFGEEEVDALSSVQLEKSFKPTKWPFSTNTVRSSSQ
ncbi:unnamed protein product [Phytophthora lilii]|uniref:Unnamed protein product n=1 Tax=Phytophthora lilii TaxID=2077276 RepID=A0A9W7CRZ0_9STRA|nr:unnamed protein product [Phytophthora lilii]